MRSARRLPPGRMVKQLPLACFDVGQFGELGLT